ncbi:hypothetical protein WICMUC_001897 [Wickerhamomyces mucosus]|uniref:non-specific serine/threonine protein kinase n=1 Tax=Wickerhamomyces mucosus TaxID=1378264 RepID=A0A9P8PT61_9ASCO|nr:hypothetical protein WICMUC_001897 [Wickerhamomyces mucosus]
MSASYDVYNEGGLLKSRYQKLEDISEGAYGYVSLAKDITKGKLVAVKYIFPYSDEEKKDGQSKSLNFKTDLEDESVCEEALHEIKIHEKLGHHPNIISFLDYFDSFIVLEYCSRGDLYEAIRSNTGPQTTRDIINVVSQLIDAVAFAHEHSIYHRDIKPENILITKDWSIRLSDWGLATTERYCKDFVVGSERYMAPELFDEGNIELYDASKCDVWSVGICLLNVVFHKNPFNIANQSDKSFAYFACNREALFDIFSSMSNDLFTTLRYCLTLDPSNRDLMVFKQELLKIQSLTIDDDIELMTKEDTEVKPITINSPKSNQKLNYRNNHHYNYNHNNHNQNNHPDNNRHKHNHYGQNNKSFAVHTPNTHINNHFQNFRKEMFNRKDYFTPPSVSAHYMEKFDQERKSGKVYQPPHQRLSRTPNNPSTSQYLRVPGSSSPAKQSRKSHSSSFNSGKYVPPNLRTKSYRESLKNMSNHDVSEALVFEDDDDDDDGLFVLEESSLDHDISNHLIELSLNDDDNFARNIHENDYNSDLSSSPSVFSSTTGRFPSNKSNASTLHNKDSPPPAHKSVYIPPHHRSNFICMAPSGLRKQQQWDTSNNHYGRKPRRYSHNIMNQSIKNENISTSVPTKGTDWWLKDELYNDDFDDAFEKSDSYKKFANKVGRIQDNDENHGFKHQEKNKALVRESIREIEEIV